MHEPRTGKRIFSPQTNEKGLKGKAAAVLKHDHVMRDFLDVFHEMRFTDGGKEDPKWTETKSWSFLRRVLLVRGSTLHPTGRCCKMSYDETERPRERFCHAPFDKSSSLPRVMTGYLAITIHCTEKMSLFIKRVPTLNGSLVMLRQEEEHVYGTKRVTAAPRRTSNGAEEPLREGLVMELLSAGTVVDRRIGDVRLSNVESVATWVERQGREDWRNARRCGKTVLEGPTQRCTVKPCLPS